MMGRTQALFSRYGTDLDDWTIVMQVSEFQKRPARKRQLSRSLWCQEIP
jgi:hypothetical protein